MYDILVKALQTLADHCDGAQSEDSVGFNKGDSYLGKDLANQTRAGYDISEQNQFAAIKMLQKYRHQLEGYGIQLPTIPQYVGIAPSNLAPVSGRSKAEQRISVNYNPFENKLALKSPYDPQLVARVRAIPSARWQPLTKEWYVPCESGKSLITALDGYVYHLTDEADEALRCCPAPAPKPAAPPQPVTPVTIGEQDGQYSIHFPFDPKLVEKVKAISRRKFNPDNKSWLVPADCDDEMMNALKGYEIVWDTRAKLLCERTAKIRAASLMAEADLEIPNVTGELMPFQKAGVAFIDQCGGRAIIGDDMGLGKTIQAIGYLALHPDLRPAVIVAPASLKSNWRRELEKWLTTKEYVHIINGTKPYDVPGSTIFIINYDILDKWTTWLKMLNPAVLICDEAHMIKSPKSNRTKAVMQLARYSEKVVLMTGTPLMNRPVELFPLLQAVRPEQWTNFMGFARRYCGAKQMTRPVYNPKTRQKEPRQVWDFTGASNLRELNDKLKTVMIRRLKSQVLTELPAKRRVTIPMPVDLKKYGKFMEQTLKELKAANNQAAQLALIEQAKQYVLMEKMPQMLEWIENFLESGEKLILFCTHKMAVAAFVERYPHAVVITGDSSQHEREMAVEDFQHDPDVELFIGNIQAAGVGLTLTAASNVAFAELAWRPGDHTQAEDRAHRIGQQNAVTVWYLLAEGTIDEQIFGLLEKKRTVVEAVADGKVAEMGFDERNVAQDLVQMLLSQAKERA